MTAGSLLDMYLISCLTCLHVGLLVLLLDLLSFGLHPEFALLITHPDGLLLSLHGHQRPWSKELGSRKRHRRQR